MIKKTIGFLAIASLVITVSCKEKVLQEGGATTETTASSDEVAGKAPVMTFEESEFDFGDINPGDKVEHIFTFTNTGESDLLITDAKGSCGCTVPDYKKDPIKPGEKSSMKVTFDSTGKSGQQQKTVTISANTASGNELLTIKASVAPKPAGIGVAK